MEMMLKTFAQLTEYMGQILQFFESIIGVDPMLMVPVIFFVFISRKAIGWGMKKLFGKEFVEDYRKTGIALVIMCASTLVVYLFGTCTGGEVFWRCAFILGPITALFYQMFKPLVVKLVKKFPKIMLSKMGISNEKANK